MANYVEPMEVQTKEIISYFGKNEHNWSEFICLCDIKPLQYLVVQQVRSLTKQISCILSTFTIL